MSGKARSAVARRRLALLAVALLGGACLAAIGVGQSAEPSVAAVYSGVGLAHPFTVAGRLYETTLSTTTDKLYEFDGTGFDFVADIPVAAADFVSYDGVIYFTADAPGSNTCGCTGTDDEPPTALYSFDGTTASVVSGAPANPNSLVLFDNELYLVGNSATGTQLYSTADVATFYPVAGSPSGLNSPVVYDDQIFLSGFSGSAPAWFRFNGLEFDQVTNAPGYISEGTVYNGQLYFHEGGDGDVWDLNRFSEVNASFANLTGNLNLYLDTSYVVYDGKLYFGADADTDQWGLYSYDGSSFVRLGSATGIDPQSFAVYDGALYYTALGADDTWSTYSYVAPTPHSNATLPTISGTAQVGQTLTAAPDSTWPAGTTFTYVWFSAAGRSADTSSTYVVQPADVGGIIAVDVYGTEPGYGATYSGPAVTPVVSPAQMTPSTVSIVGEPMVGNALTATAARWPAADGLTYRWLRSGVPIAGATKSTYVPVFSDAGHALSVVVTSHEVGYTEASAASRPVLVLSGFAPTPPTITVSRLEGTTLTAHPGSWGHVSVAFTYQWYRDGIAIRGATKATYIPSASDAREWLSVAVTGSTAASKPVTQRSTQLLFG